MKARSSLTGGCAWMSPQKMRRMWHLPSQQGEMHLQHPSLFILLSAWRSESFAKYPLKRCHPVVLHLRGSPAHRKVCCQTPSPAPRLSPRPRKRTSAPKPLYPRASQVKFNLNRTTTPFGIKPSCLMFPQRSSSIPIVRQKSATHFRADFDK